MPITRLETKRVEKPWGRRELWPGFEAVKDGGDPVGEVWFQEPGQSDPELLVKYLFTSEKLSIQVHPNDEEARAKGHPRGKDEAWLILAAEPHATIAIGTREVMSKEDLRASALDGSIEDKMDWKAVKAGDFFYSPAGTVHAIGPGLTLIEIQQNVDLTYRLYDYGSDRELHLDDGVAVSDPVPYVASSKPFEHGPGRVIMADGPAFVMERWTFAGAGRLSGDGRPFWIVPVKGEAVVDGESISPGGVWLADGACDMSIGEGSDILIAYPGKGLIAELWTG